VTHRDDRNEPALLLPANVVRVPPVKQTTGYSCGAAAALAMLRFWRPAAYDRVTERDLYSALGTTEARGTEPEPIVSYLREFAALEADYRSGDVTVAELERALDAGEPPVVDLQAWRDVDAPYREVWDAGHYAIFVGYDAKHLFFMDPSVMTPSGYAYLLREELDERWHDLAGDQDVRVERMTIFVRGAGKRPSPLESDPRILATKLG
jgi:predicted double-glycine peptidase